MEVDGGSTGAACDELLDWPSGVDEVAGTTAGGLLSGDCAADPSAACGNQPVVAYPAF